MTSYFTLNIELQLAIFTFKGIISLFIGGLSGLFIDSYLGALFQSLFLKDQLITERKTDTLIKGFAWMNNDMVNLLSVLAASIITMVLFSIN